LHQFKQIQADQDQNLAKKTNINYSCLYKNI